MEYTEKLHNFFEGIKALYRSNKSEYEGHLKRFFMPLLFQYRIAKEVKRQTDRYLA